MEVDVPYVSQSTPFNCWRASYKMMLSYNHMSESLIDKLPNVDKMEDRGILDSEFEPSRKVLGLKSYTADALSSADKLEAILKSTGPIWCSGSYVWDSDQKRYYKHVVVVRGVSTHWYGEDEVYVNDPWRGYKGCQEIGFWWGWNKFWTNLNHSAGNCQYWG